MLLNGLGQLVQASLIGFGTKTVFFGVGNEFFSFNKAVLTIDMTCVSSQKKLIKQNSVFCHYTEHVYEVTLIRVVALSNTSIQVIWTTVRPDKHKGNPNGYAVRYQVFSSPTYMSLPVQAGINTLTITGLQVYTNYSISISASGLAGSGPYSAKSTAQTAEGGKYFYLSRCVSVVVLLDRALSRVVSG